jgi:hypothetical protein
MAGKASCIVEIHLQTRRFRCLNKECARKILAESSPAVAARKARKTMRLCEIVGLVGYALGGLPGERLLDRLGIRVATIQCYGASRGEDVGDPAGRACAER